MKLFVLALLFATQTHAQSIIPALAEKLSNEIVDCIKKNSIFKDSLNYETIAKDFAAHLDTFNTYQEVGYYYVNQLRKVGDRHSFYVSQTKMQNASVKQKDSTGFSFQLLDGNIGYLNIPGFMSLDNSVVIDFANRIHNAIREMDSNGNIKGWIVDLRNNTGGNMWPMVLGLGPLIGKGTPGYFVNNKNDASGWKINSPSNGVVIYNPYQLKNRDARIAILYSKHTASSGEMTAVCFIGKPNCRSFGTATAGLTTANRMFNLSDGNIFVLASTYVMDRDKKKYTGSIMPDVVFGDAWDKRVVEEAKEWIRQ